MSEDVSVPTALRAPIADLGLHGAVIEVHASMRSFSTPVAAIDLIDSFYELGVTSIYPAFSHAFEVRPSTAVQMSTNGYTYGVPTPWVDIVEYQRDHLHIDASMGVLPKMALHHGAVRGDHPFNSFCATGPLANEIVATQTPDDTYAPIEAAAARAGKLLMIGVGLERATCIHHAERLSGREQFFRWYCVGGALHHARTGGCSAAFSAFEAMVTPPVTATCLGSTWLMYDLATLLGEVAFAIDNDSYIGLCDRARCDKCRVERLRIDRR